MDRNCYLEFLKKAYSGNYNVHEAEDEFLKLKCDTHISSGSYVISRKNVMWEMMSHEYCYIYSVKQLTREKAEAFLKYVYDTGMEQIDLKNNHMSTVLTLVVLCDECDKDALKMLKHCHLHKEFRMGLDGWMDFHTALLDMTNEKVYTNMSGHDLKKPFRRYMRMLTARAQGTRAGAEQPAGLS